MSSIETLLIDKLGVEPAIATFFAHRRKPANNDYWLNSETYVSLSTGYIFIPVFFDLLLKRGIPHTQLLDENLLKVMESILQSAGKMEYKKITHQQHIEDCRSTLKNAGVSIDQIERAERLLVRQTFSSIPARFVALRRADTFLYTFAGRPLDYDILFKSWEVLLPLILMLDDFADVVEDHATGEENCLLDSEMVPDNFFELVSLANKMLDNLSTINPSLATYLRNLKDEAVATNMLTILKMGGAGIKSY